MHKKDILFAYFMMIGQIGITYEAYGSHHDWPVWAGFQDSKSGSWALMMSVPWVVAGVIYFGISWGVLYAIAIFAASFLAAWILTLVLRQYVQAVWWSFPIVSALVLFLK